jgi:hypothetical protein
MTCHAYCYLPLLRSTIPPNDNDNYNMRMPSRKSICENEECNTRSQQKNCHGNWYCRKHYADWQVLPLPGGGGLDSWVCNSNLPCVGRLVPFHKILCHYCRKKKPVPTASSTGPPPAPLANSNGNGATNADAVTAGTGTANTMDAPANANIQALEAANQRMLGRNLKLKARIKELMVTNGKLVEILHGRSFLNPPPHDNDDYDNDDYDNDDDNNNNNNYDYDNDNYDNDDYDNDDDNDNDNYDNDDDDNDEEMEEAEEASQGGGGGEFDGRDHSVSNIYFHLHLILCFV